ncbi:hypothetical protein CEP54_000744 [Fusarium duplospermum]|uniref:Uncharacterized protein n=1 Tax=Fusarium duplospermum TaxID=1325734 RepID=A0A428R5E7_9HYPO|nr:hypothetical protein CEP54_000744 [Fusarium duplospermum]
MWVDSVPPLSHHPKSGRSRASTNLATRRRALPVAVVNLYTILSLRTFELVSSVRLFGYLIGLRPIDFPLALLRRYSRFPSKITTTSR